MFLNVLIESPIRFSLGAPLESDFACAVFASKSRSRLCFSKEKPPSCLFLAVFGASTTSGQSQGWCPCRGVRAGAAHGIGTRSMSPEHDPGTGAQQQLLGLSQSREAALN